MIDISVTIRPSFYKKLSKETIKHCESKAIELVTKEAESECKSICPYDTGNLSRSHSSEIEEEVGLVTNSAEYAQYVIHGTTRMEARNYPLEVANKIVSEKKLSTAFKKELRSNGVSQ